MNLNNAQILLRLQISKLNLDARIYYKKGGIAFLCRAISELSGIYREYSTYHIKSETGSDDSGQPHWTVTCSTPEEAYTTSLYDFLHQALGIEKDEVERLEAELNKVQKSVIWLEQQLGKSLELEREIELKNEREQELKELIMEALKDWLEQIQELIQKRKQELENERKNQQSGQSRGRGGR